MQFRFADFVLDLDAYRLERSGVPVALEPKAFDVLALLVQQPEHLFTKQAIFDAVWPKTAVTDHALTRVVAQLRRVLGDEAREATYIETIPTRGYRWIRPVERVTAAVAPTQEEARTALPEDDATRTVRGLTAYRRGDSLFSWRPARLAAAILLATAVVGLGLWARSGARPVDAEVVARDSHDVQWPVQLTTHPGLDMHPALSPQGDAVAYVSDRGGAFEIYVRALAGTATETPLTSDGGHNVQPAWSPDGRFIAYHSYGRGGIWVVPARGGVPRQVVVTGSKPAWSPDGRRLAYQSDEHIDVTPSAFGAQSGSTIWIVGADGHEAREMTRAGQPVGGHAAPAWSSDGRYLAFTLFEAGPDNGIWLHTLDSGETRPLARGPGLYDVVFAPDDSGIYASGGDALVVRIPFDPDNPFDMARREIIPLPGVPGVRGLSISSDGRRLAFAGAALNSHIWAQPVTPDGVPRGEPRALTDDTSRRNSLPAVSPDGTRVAYMSTRMGSAPHVWVMDVDGRNRIQMSSDETANFEPNWFPDGQRVAFLSYRGHRMGLWAVDVATRREELWLDATKGPDVARMRGRLAEFDLSPSSTRAAFAMITEPAGRRVIYAASLSPFEPRELTDGAMSVGYPSWSPDERSLAVEVKDGSSTHAGVIEVETGALRMLTRERGETWVRSWSPDGRKVAFAALRDGAWNLQWVDVTTGQRGDLTAPLPPSVYVRYPEWSPRGDLIVYERGELRGNVWLVQVR
ncbi:MAG TPA: winged helix-turn-helix domain-containing protein [Vicinamibacterales bacterium]|nr:winged helix-turn-helix domain-containing protein [Vicinamibacterales bacterium]